MEVLSGEKGREKTARTEVQQQIAHRRTVPALWLGQKTDWDVGHLLSFGLVLEEHGVVSEDNTEEQTQREHIFIFPYC